MVKQFFVNSQEKLPDNKNLNIIVCLRMGKQGRAGSSAGMNA
jgi:hypothetical protein